MAYIDTQRRSDLNIKQDDLLASKRFVLERKPDSSYFYELEEAVVLDIILDEKHPAFTDTVDVRDCPPNIDGGLPSEGTLDYGRIGCVKFRFLNSERGKDKEQLNWAYPIENTGITEWPLMNETVIVGRYSDKFFYSRKLNSNSVINSNANFGTERVTGWVDENLNEYNNNAPYTGPRSQMNYFGGDDYTGVLGNYFKFNSKIRSLKRYEGDTILESRFGSSIRFGAYDSVRGNDSGLGEYEDRGGNPMVLIRNRQAPIKNPQGKTAKGYTTEDINKDGSSVHITSGKTVSGFKSVVEKPMISGNVFIPIPKMDGDQIIINSDRLIFSTKANEMLFFSKKRVAISTDHEVSIDAFQKITITSNELLSVNAPKIYLGNHGKEYEPAILGRTAVNWLNALGKVLIANIDSQIEILNATISHFHIGNLGKPTSPPQDPAASKWKQQLTKLQNQKASLEKLRVELTTLMSSRVFVMGGVDQE